MSQKLVECVPNFSEGRDLKVVNAIADAIKKVPGVTLLDVDPGTSTNRTVFTFVADPAAIIEGALAGARVAHALIDMAKQKGAHVRVGALDVCPFIPVAGVTMEDCIKISKEFGERLAAELKVPVYLYEHSARQEYRKTLVQIRKGEYEAIPERIVQEQWEPDFGPAKFVPNWGATITGARGFLIAYNVNILGTKEQAHRITLNLRENGRGKDEPGRLKKVKGMGWYVDEYKLAQCSFNLEDYHVTPIHVAFEECVKDAKEIGVGVAGSEVVGLLPLESLLMAASFYEEKEGLFLLDVNQRIRLVVERLGLSSCSYFDPQKRIIEFAVGKKEEPLAGLTVRKFIESVGARSSAPGGGSVSALISSLGSALGLMMGWMSYGNRQWADLDPQMRKLIRPLYNTMHELIPQIDADTDAFNRFMNALKMPQSTAEEKKERFNEMQLGLQEAVVVPLGVMEKSCQCWESMIELAKIGNINCSSDLAVGAKSLETGIWGAHKNVIINLKQIKDEEFKKKTNEKADYLMKLAHEKCAQVVSILEEREK